MDMGTILKLAAAGLFGAAVVLLALAAWTLIQRQRAIRAGGALTSMRRAEMRQQALEESPLFRFFLPIITALSASVNQLGLDPLREYVHTPYVRAGYPGGLDDDEVLATGILLSAAFTFFIGFVATALGGLAFSWLALIGIPAGFFVLVVHLRARAKEREVEILRSLPYVLDLLVLMLRSGTSMRIAMGRVIEDYSRHPFGIELGQVIAEIDVGAHRAEAFKKMADRLKIPDITSLVDAIVQSEELGWPLADTLERLADRLNSERILNAQAKAGAAGVYVMIPSTLVLLAAVLILFAPFIVSYIVTGSIV
ncbi:MAG TPA: type II secretion system F family protein [Phycisphaerae bacterium]|jgi:tight adherence protein C|nr:type II secretion system F family protein [Phycisphaerae bacterium]